MIRNWTGVVVGLAALSLLAAGCNETAGAGTAALSDADQQTKSTSKDRGIDGHVVSTFGILPDCSSQLAGETVTVKSEAADYTCIAKRKEWVKSYSSRSKLPSCKSKNEGAYVYVNNVDSFFYCISSEWVAEGDKEKKDGDSSNNEGSTSDGGSTDNDGGSTSDGGYGTSTGGSSNSNSNTNPSTNPTTSSQSSGGQSGGGSISVTKITGTVSCSSAMFCGKMGDTRVMTGYTGGTEGGWWWTAADENGTSFYWPYGLDEWDSFVGASVMPYGGIHGSVDFMGTDAWAKMAFNVKDPAVAVDISNWSGLCIIYQADAPISLQVVPLNSKTVTGYNDPSAILPATTQPALANLTWSQFTQAEGWEISVATSTVVKSVESIGLKFTGASGESLTFSLIAIGKYNTCK